MTTATIHTADHHAAALAQINDELVRMHALLAITLKLKDSPRKTSQLEQIESWIEDLEASEQTILDMQASAEIGAEAAEVAEDLDSVEAVRAPVLKRAMREARKAGTALVRCAAGVGRAMDLLVEGGCAQHLAGLSSWCVIDENTGETWRLTLARGASTGVMRYWVDPSYRR